MKQYDFIIVGGGSAGCVLGNRLSEQAQVLVLEAGRKDYWWDLFVHMPAALTYPIGSSRDWKYQTLPEPYMNNRQVYHARGKILGGSSSINGMIFIRGNKMDFEKWASFPGMKKWGYRHCLPYFIRSEQCLERDTNIRGKNGPLHLEVGPCKNPLFQAFFKAVTQAKLTLTDDVNGLEQEGFGRFDRNIKNGMRFSAAKAYLHPVLHRKNLELQCKVHVLKIIFEKKKAVGVFCRVGNKTQTFYGKEIILCGGAFNTPQLLQLSGIGDKEHLESLGIKIIEDRSGVGKNLQDHLEVYVQYACKEKVSLAPSLKWWRKPGIGLQWLLFKKGPASSNHFEAGGFMKSHPSCDYPNLQFHFLPLAIRYDGSLPRSNHGYQVHIGPMNSDARGFVKIKSQDPLVHPDIQFNYLSTEQDRNEWVAAIHHARNILNQEAFLPFNGGELSPGPEVNTDEDILNWVKRDAETALHPSCTAKMGLDDQAVIHPDTLKVHGVEGLRVVDASIMPTITNGNLYAPVIMLAEKASDIILGNTPLAPMD